MDENPQTTNIPVSVPEDTPAPSTDTPEAPAAPEVPAAPPETPAEDIPAGPAADSVPGTPDTPAAPPETLGEPQPQAPNPVPATAAPDVDTVTTNTHLRKIADDLSSLITYVDNFLSHLESAEDVKNALQSAVTVVSQEIK